MLRRIRSRLTYANVMSTVGVFIALGGVSYAAVKLPRNSVGGAQIKKNAVTGSKVRNSSLTGADVKNSSLTGSDLKEQLTHRQRRQGRVADRQGLQRLGSGGGGTQGRPGRARSARSAGRRRSLCPGDPAQRRGRARRRGRAGQRHGGPRVLRDRVAADRGSGAAHRRRRSSWTARYEDGADSCRGSFESPTAPPGHLCIYGSLGSAVGSNTDEQEGTAAGGINGRVTPLRIRRPLLRQADGRGKGVGDLGVHGPVARRESPRPSARLSLPPRFIATYLVSRYSWRPSGPPSRP